MHDTVIWISGSAPDSAVQAMVEQRSVRLHWAISLADARTCQGSTAAVAVDLPAQPNQDAASLLRAVQAGIPGRPILLRQQDATIADAVHMIKLGAEQFFGDDVDDLEFARQLVAVVES